MRAKFDALHQYSEHQMKAASWPEILNFNMGVKEAIAMKETVVNFYTNTNRKGTHFYGLKVIINVSINAKDMNDEELTSFARIDNCYTHA